MGQRLLPSNWRRVRGPEPLSEADRTGKPAALRGLHGGGTEDPGALLERVGLEQDGDKLVAEFSKGMRGRLTFARALLHRPGLLFLDEPTAGLDPVTARRSRQVIREARDGGATVFLTTHDMVTANELCDRVAFLVDGQIAALDSPRSLRVAYGRKVVRVESVSDGTRIAREFAIGGLADDSDFLGLLRSGAVETIHNARDHARGCLRASHRKTARMTPILHALRWDVIVQARNGFYWASAFLVIIISALLLNVPESARVNSAIWVPAILAVNLQITTFFFVAGLMLLERDEGTLNALAVSPPSASGYLAMRTFSLTGLAAAETIAIVWIGFGTGGSWLLILGGTAALGIFYTCFGAAVATGYDSVNALLLPASAFVALLLLPFCLTSDLRRVYRSSFTHSNRR